MYTPPFNQVSDEQQIRAMVVAARAGWLVTVGDDQVPVATLLPVMWRGDTVIAHQAKANPQWRQIGDGASGLIIIDGAQAYISPSWYAAKKEHGKVVPTWNYSAVHLTGTVRVHQDPEWLRSAVTDLTQLHESGRDQPWQVTDAPDRYVEGQLRGIVGIELTVIRVEGKAKLSQNRSVDDQHGVVDGLRTEALTAGQRSQARAVADQMELRIDPAGR